MDDQEAARLGQQFNLLVSEQMVMYRGTLLTSFAQVEWFMAELIIKLADHPAYAGLKTDFSIKVDRRIETLQAMMAIDEGPLAAYRTDLEPVLLDISEYEDFRNFMAHGVVSVKFDAGANPRVLFRMYRMFKGGELMSGELPTDLKTFGEATIKIGDITKRFLALVRRIWNELNLPLAG